MVQYCMVCYAMVFYGLTSQIPDLYPGVCTRHLPASRQDRVFYTSLVGDCIEMILIYYFRLPLVSAPPRSVVKQKLGMVRNYRVNVKTASRKSESTSLRPPYVSSPPPWRHIYPSLHLYLSPSRPPSPPPPPARPAAPWQPPP